MNKSREVYVTVCELFEALNKTSYKEEMLKQSDLFYIIYFWIQMENYPSMDLMYDPKFRDLHLRNPVMRNLTWRYLGINRSRYLTPQS